MADTADIVQDAILRTLTRLDKIDVSSRGALQAYLQKAVMNRVNDEFRVIARRGGAVALADDYQSPAPSPYEEAAAEDLQERYKAALRSLREKDRALIVGHVELEYSLDQLACVIGSTRGATRVALRRALVRLAQTMGTDVTALRNAQRPN